MSEGRAARSWFPALAAVLAGALSWLLAEGVHSVMGGAQAETSLAYALYARVVAPVPASQADPLDATTAMIANLGTIEEMLPRMKESGIGLGNSPFSELKTEATSMNSDLGECREQKPDLHKIVGFLRTNLFNPFDQMTFFHDAGRVLPPELEAFLQRYAFRRVRHTTNGFGERITLPAVESPRKVLVAGDSVANGSMLDDTETLASQLQARDSGRQYVNLGIAGAKAADIACALERAAERYRGQIDELVYVLCENDWLPGAKYGTPDELADWIEAFRRKEEIRAVSLVYVPYIYNTAPELTRLRGHLFHDFPANHDEKHRILERSAAAGYRVVDYLEITNAERERLATQFATLALYVDHAHPSRTGVERIVDRLLGPRG